MCLFAFYLLNSYIHALNLFFFFLKPFIKPKASYYINYHLPTQGVSDTNNSRWPPLCGVVSHSQANPNFLYAFSITLLTGLLAGGVFCSGNHILLFPIQILWFVLFRHTGTLLCTFLRTHMLSFVFQQCFRGIPH